MNCKYLLSSFVLVACCLQQCCWGQSTTVRPYKFGFNIDQQQHRREMRDERGIVMGEFGFITADGIYHVTVYATDEQGRFRILAMKNYPYESPPKTVEVMVQPKTPPKTTTTTTTTTTPKPLARHNFNTEACSGCFLTNGNNKPKGSSAPPKTDIRPLSKALPNSSASAASVPNNSNETPTGHIHTVHSTQTQAKFATAQDTLYTNPLTFFPNKVKAKLSNKNGIATSTSQLSESRTTSNRHINENGLTQNSSRDTQVLRPFGITATKHDITTPLTNFDQHLKRVTETNLEDNHATKSKFNHRYETHTYLNKSQCKSNRGPVQPVDVAHKCNFKTPFKTQDCMNNQFYKGPHEQHKNADKPFLNTNKEGTSILSDQSQIMSYKVPKTKSTSPDKSALKSATAVNRETRLKSTALSQNNSLASKPPSSTNIHTSSTNSTALNKTTHPRNSYTTATIKSLTQKQSNTARPVFSNVNLNRKFSSPKTDSGLPASPTAKTASVNPPPIMDIIMQKVLPALMGKTGPSAASSPTQSTALNNNNSPNAVPTGQKPGSSNKALPKKPTVSSGSSTLNGDGDLYRFKYILDYHGHTETGKRNGNKEGSYFAIGDDNVERTIEYVANEFGYQPRVRYRKLDSNEIKSTENTLKDYEFVWFQK